MFSSSAYDLDRYRFGTQLTVPDMSSHVKVKRQLAGDYSFIIWVPEIEQGLSEMDQVPLPAGNLDNPSSLIYCFIRTSGIGTISQKWNCDQ